MLSGNLFFRYLNIPRVLETFLLINLIWLGTKQLTSESENFLADDRCAGRDISQNCAKFKLGRSLRAVRNLGIGRAELLMNNSSYFFRPIFWESDFVRPCFQSWGSDLALPSPNERFTFKIRRFVSNETGTKDPGQ